MEGCVNVEGRVIFHDDALLLVTLRFGEHGTIHEHPGPNDTIVACLEGSGFTSVGGESEPIEAGQRVFWPKGVVHRLWTEGSTMITLMTERYSEPGRQAPRG
jgi:mannose-6-phosphate isomerase-like protein (cupin superfamily)